ncbi:MAG: hypothetical protein ACRDMJ_16430, partial [Solirubrobacteraceae bacterium]
MGLRTLIATVAVTLGWAASAQALPVNSSYTGTVGGCSYALDLNANDATTGTWSGSTSSCAAGAITATLSGDYTGNEVSITSESATATLGSQSITLSDAPGGAFSTGPAGLYSQAGADALMTGAMGELEQQALAQIAGGPMGSSGIVPAIEQVQRSYCESLASQQGYTSDVCSEPNCPSSGCAELPQTASTASISAGS